MKITPEILERAVVVWALQLAAPSSQKGAEITISQAASHLWLLLEKEKRTKKARLAMLWRWFGLVVAFWALLMLVVSVYRNDIAASAFCLVILLGAQVSRMEHQLARIAEKLVSS